MNQLTFYKIISKLKYFFFTSFGFLLPLHQKVSTLNIVVLFIFSVIGFKKEFFLFKKEMLPPIFIYLGYCLSLSYSTEFQISVFELKSSLIVFPLIFLMDKNLEKYFNITIKFFIIGCIVALLFCNLNALFNSINLTNLSFDSKTENDIFFWNSLVQDKNFFFAKNFSIIHQTVYFSMYLTFSVSILLYRKIFEKRIQKIIIIFLSIGVFQLLNKAGLLVFFMVISLKLFYFNQNKRKAIISIILLFFIGASMFYLNPRFRVFNSNFSIEESEFKVTEFKKMPNYERPKTNTRILFWVSAIDLIKKNPLFGIGAGGANKKLSEVYAIKAQWYDKRDRYNAHNQYLQIILHIGLIGFIPFILLFYFLLKARDSNINSKIIISIILIFSINFLFESVFERYSGISFFCFIYCVFIKLFLI